MNTEIQRRCKLDSQLGPTFSSQTDLFSFCWWERSSGSASRGHSLRHTVLPHVLRVAVRDDGTQLVNVLPQLMHLQQLGPQSVLHQWLLALLGRAAHRWNRNKDFHQNTATKTQATILKENISHPWSSVRYSSGGDWLIDCFKTFRE